MTIVTLHEVCFEVELFIAAVVVAFVIVIVTTVVVLVAVVADCGIRTVSSS